MPLVYLSTLDGVKIPIHVDSEGRLVLSPEGEVALSGQSDVRIFGYEGDTWEAVNIDASTRSMNMISYEHHEIHSGRSFVAVHNATLADGATIKLSFKTPNTTRYAHMVVEARGSGESNVLFGEGATVTDNTGSAKPVYNRNRNSANVTGMIDTSTNPDTAGQITVGATVTNNGTVFYQEHFGSGNVVGGASRGTEEFVLKPNTQYVVVFTSEANSNDAELILNWYEHVDK